MLPGHRSLGTFALEELGDTRVVQLPAGGGRRGKRRLVISTHADGPTRVLRVVDVTSHPPAPGGLGAPTGAAEAGGGGGGGARRAAPTGQALVRQLRATLPRGLAQAGSWGSGDSGDAGDGDAAVPPPAAAAAGHHGTPDGPALPRLLPLPSSGGEGGGGPGDADAAATPDPAPHQQQQRHASPPRRARAAAAGRGSPSGAGGGPQSLLDARAELRGVCLSVVSDGEELLFAALRGVAGRLTVDAVRVRGAFALDSVRVENTLYGAQYPLLLASPVKPSVFGVTYEGGSGDAATPLLAADGGEGGEGGGGGSGGGGRGGAPPALGVLCTLWRDRPGGVACFERLGVHLAPLAVSLEGLHLKSLLDFGAAMQAAAARHGLAPGGGPTSSGGRGALAAAAAAPPAVHPLPRRQPLKLYFEEWYISPLQLCITFAPGSWFEPPPAGGGEGPGGGAGAGARESGGGAAGGEDEAESRVAAPALAAAAPPVWAQIAAALAHTEGAWLTLGAFHQRHPLLGVDALSEVRRGRAAAGSYSARVQAFGSRPEQRTAWTYDPIRCPPPPHPPPAPLPHHLTPPAPRFLAATMSWPPTRSCPRSWRPSTSSATPRASCTPSASASGTSSLCPRCPRAAARCAGCRS
jgi:hypothetical protein